MPHPHRARPRRITPVCTLLVTALLGAAQSAAGAACATPGAWVDPADGRRLEHAEVIAGAAGRGIVLLGETHDRVEHHRWQLSVLAGLRARTDNLAVGFESFPRRVQGALDDWVRGALPEREFLVRSDWAAVWSFDPALYMPLFEFARMHRMPMVALNVERSLVAKVGRDGWDAVSESEREGVGDPAPASAAYRIDLAKVFREHAQAKRADPERTDTDPEPELPSVDEVLDDPAFARFVEAQLTWDRAMAEALARAHRGPGHPTVVGIIGSGHLLHRHGVPHQLAALGIDDVAVLLPVADSVACDEMRAGVADALFVVVERSPTHVARPRLGVLVETAETGVRIVQVFDDTVAAAAGLAPGDLVREAAGTPLDTHTQLIEIVLRQAPGTWLPMVVERDDEKLDVVARFPPVFE